MAFCLVPNFPAVVLALEGLSDLNKQLKRDGVPFASEASVHLTALAAAITELEDNRRTTHEHLEVETIENSKLRHQIQTMSERMSEEITADVAAVRASYAEEIEQLSRGLNVVSQHQVETVKKLQALLNQNKALNSEREQEKAEHEAVIATLNDQISLKYNLQEQLDQRLQQTEELKSSIAAVKQEQIVVQQSMTLNREACSEKKDSLCREINEIEEKIKQQERAIAKSTEVLGTANDRKERTLNHLGELSRKISLLESNLQKVTACRCQLEQRLEEDIKRNQELRQQIEMQKNEFQESQETLSFTLQNIQEQISTIKEKIEISRASGPLLRNTLSRVFEMFKRQRDEENKVQAERLHASQQLKRSKLQLEECVTSIVIYKKEMKEMQKQINDFREAEEITRRVFELKRKELGNDLEEVKENISQCEEETRQLGQLLEEMKSRQEEHVKKMMFDISNTKRKCEELLQEEAALLSKSTDADSLMSNVTQTEKEYRQMKSIHQQEVQQITAETEDIYGSTEEKQRALEEKEETLKEVEVKWTQEEKRHDRLGELIRELSRKRTELELLIQHTMKQTNLLLQPKENLKAKLEELQESFTDLLSKYSSELRAVEVSIYNNTVILEQVRMENSRMHLRVGQMTEDVDTYRQEKERYQQGVQELKHKTKHTLVSLQTAWKEDISVTLECESSDEVLLVSMNLLLNQLKTREQQLMNASSLLHQQRLDFSKRLGDKAATKLTTKQEAESRFRKQTCSENKIGVQSSN